MRGGSVPPDDLQPLVQSEHAVLPALEVYCPAGHKSHFSVSAAAANEPGRHGAGSAEPTEHEVPSIDSIDRQWYLVDAENQTLGRLATEVASVLRGKNKASFTPHLDTGDFVIVVNADKIRVSGKKSQQKLYRRHSGRPGGMKVETFEHLQERLPERIVEKAIKGMLPHNALGRQLFRKLKVYKGTEHPHAAQQPKTLQLDPAASAQ